MFGRGIDTAITSAYEWLMDNYEPEDETFIFGFSRGAYTARSLSGFISICGLLQRGAPLGVNQLYKRHRRDDETTIRDLIAQQAAGRTDFPREERWILKYGQAVPIKFIGIFDTVGALGVPFELYRKLKGEAYPFLNTGLRQNNEYAFHAMAIDEHRKDFRQTLWTNMGALDAKPRPIERTEQRWFVGAHANVGGGCFDDPLAQLPFGWLQRKAEDQGLAFTGKFPAEPDAETETISDSFAAFAKGWYRLYRFGRRFYRPIGVPPKEEGEGVKIINETIDASVFDRWRKDEKYRPPGVVQWAQRMKVDPTKITTSVRTDDPAIQAAD